MTNDKPPCHKNCFWYCNDYIWTGRWGYVDCAYYKCCIFPTKPRDWHEGDMLEPTECDKYISWDDVESIMRNCVDDITKLNHNI
jgi:hypothetical protein